MKILFLLPRYPEKKMGTTLEKELVLEFKEKGHEVLVGIIKEGDYKEKEENIFRIKTGNYNGNISLLQKGMTKLCLPFIFVKELKKRLKTKKIDLVITTTPLMNSSYIHKKLKRYYKCKVLTIVWDIFPQNAMDLGILKNSIITNILKKKFKKSLETADYITSMSQGNYNYIVEKIKLEKKKVFILKNWAKLKKIEEVNREKIRKKYNLLIEETIFVFGGNMGKPQRLDNIIELAKETKELEVRYLFVGKGTEKKRLENLVKEYKLKNVTFIDFVPREDYEKLISACDIGIVSLDERFTVPNFPSKTTDYFKLGLPILASLDNCSYNDYGYVLTKEAKAGKIARAGNVEKLKEKVMEFLENKKEREEQGKNGREYYEKELDVKIAYKTIINKIEGENNV